MSRFERRASRPMLIESAGKNLLDEDLMEMVNAGILPATVTLANVPNCGRSVFPNITPRPEHRRANEGPGMGDAQEQS